MSYMSDALSFRLPPRMRRELARLCRRQNRAASEIAREALRRYLAVERFRALRDEAVANAEARGLLTDDDVFRVVS